MATILKSSRRPLHHFWKETVDAGKWRSVFTFDRYIGSPIRKR